MPTKDNSSSPQITNEFNNTSGVDTTLPANVELLNRRLEKQPITDEEASPDVDSTSSANAELLSRRLEKQPITDEKASSNVLPTELWIELFKKTMGDKINPKLREVCKDWHSAFSEVLREKYLQQYQLREVAGKSSNLPEVEYSLVEQPEGDFAIQPGTIYLKKNLEEVSYTLLTPQKEIIQGKLVAAKASTTLEEDIANHKDEILRELDSYINPPLMDVLQKREIDYLLALEKFILEKAESSSTKINSDWISEEHIPDKAIILRLKGYLDQLRLANEGSKRRDGYYFAVLEQIRKEYQQYQEIMFLKKHTFTRTKKKLQSCIDQLEALMGEHFWSNDAYYVKREQLLDEINAELIQACIIKAKAQAQEQDQDQLKLYIERLTRVPSSVFTNPKNDNFWQTVEMIGFQEGLLRDLPLEMSKCVNLKSLHLMSNSFRKLPAVISQLTSLQELIINRNQLQTLPQEMEALTNLKKLRLSINLFQIVPSVIEKLTSLDQLFLDENFLQTLPSQLSSDILMEPGEEGQVRSSRAATLRLQKPFHLGWKVEKLITAIFVDSAEFHAFFEEIIRAEPAEWKLLINPEENLNFFDWAEPEDELNPDERSPLYFPPKYLNPLHLMLKKLAIGQFVPVSILREMVAQTDLDWNLPIVAQGLKIRITQNDAPLEDENEEFANEEFDNKAPEGEAPEGEEPEDEAPEGEAPEGEAPEGEEPEDEESDDEDLDDEDEESDDEDEVYEVDPFEVGKTPIAFFMDAASKENPAALAVLDDVLAKSTIDWDRLIQDERRMPFQGKTLVHILLDALLGGSLPAFEVLAGIANHAQLNWHVSKPLQKEPPLYALVKAVFPRADIPQERRDRALAILKKIATREDLNWDVEFSRYEEKEMNTPRRLLLAASRQGSSGSRDIFDVISANPISARVEALSGFLADDFLRDDDLALIQPNSSSSAFFDNGVSQPLTFSSSSSSHQAKRLRDEELSWDQVKLPEDEELSWFAFAAPMEAEAVEEEKSPAHKRAKHT